MFYLRLILGLLITKQALKLGLTYFQPFICLSLPIDNLCNCTMFFSIEYTSKPQTLLLISNIMQPTANFEPLFNHSYSPTY